MNLVVIGTLVIAVTNLLVKSKGAKALTSFMLMCCCLAMIFVTLDTSGWLTRLFWIAMSIYACIQVYRDLSKLNSK